MKLRIPSKLKVGGTTYKIIKDYKFIERFDLIGQIENLKCEIRLQSNDGSGKFNHDRKLQIFIHELLHAIDYVYNANKFKDDDTIERLSQGLYQVLKDNKLYA